MVKYELIEKSTGTVIDTFDNYEDAKNKLKEIGNDKHEIFFRTIYNTGEQEKLTTSEDLIRALRFIKETCAGMKGCSSCPFAREAFKRSFCMLTVGYPSDWLIDFKYSDVIDFFHKGDYFSKYGFCE